MYAITGGRESLGPVINSSFNGGVINVGFGSWFMLLDNYNLPTFTIYRIREQVSSVVPPPPAISFSKHTLLSLEIDLTWANVHFAWPEW